MTILLSKFSLKSDIWDIKYLFLDSIVSSNIFRVYCLFRGKQIDSFSTVHAFDNVQIMRR